MGLDCFDVGCVGFGSLMVLVRFLSVQVVFKCSFFFLGGFVLACWGWLDVLFEFVWVGFWWFECFGCVYLAGVF